MDPPDFSYSLTIKLTFHAKIVQNTDPCYPANPCQTWMINKHFQLSVISID